MSVVLTFGEAMASLDLNYRAQLWSREQARPVPVVDPIGAGDAFVAGYLSARLDGLPIPARGDLALLDAGPQEAVR